VTEPQVVGCSWIDDREFAGRGRGDGVTFQIDPTPFTVAARQAVNSFQVLSMSMDQVAKVAQDTAARMKQRSE